MKRSWENISTLIVWKQFEGTILYLAFGFVEHFVNLFKFSCNYFNKKDEEKNSSTENPGYYKAIIFRF